MVHLVISTGMPLLHQSIFFSTARARNQLTWCRIYCDGSTQALSCPGLLSNFSIHHFYIIAICINRNSNILLLTMTGLYHLRIIVLLEAESSNITKHQTSVSSSLNPHSVYKIYGEGSLEEISARILADNTFSEEERKARQQQWLALFRSEQPDKDKNPSPAPVGGSTQESPSTGAKEKVPNKTERQNSKRYV